MNEASHTSSVELIDDRFGLQEILGEGSQGTTYRAIDRESGRDVAVKVLEFEAIEEWKSMELFEREAEALEQLDHPQIPDYIDAHHDQAGEAEHFYLAQEYVEGTDLEAALEEGERWSEREGKAFIRKMLEILKYLQSFSPPVVHRDIKPSNIVRRPDGELALIDFGAVQTVLPDKKGGDTFMGMGTNGYMAPEQLRGQAGPASDVYAVAATAVHLMSGVHPLEMPMEKMALRFEEVVDVSDNFRSVLEQMLAPDVEARPADAEAALDLLARGGAPDAIEGHEHLLIPEEAPDSMRSTVRATDDQLEVEVPTSGERWLSLLSSGIEGVAYLFCFLLAGWAFREQMGFFWDIVAGDGFYQGWSYLESMPPLLYVVFVLVAWLPLVTWGGGTLAWFPTLRKRLSTIDKLGVWGFVWFHLFWLYFFCEYAGLEEVMNPTLSQWIGNAAGFGSIAWILAAGLGFGWFNRESLVANHLPDLYAEFDRASSAAQTGCLIPLLPAGLFATPLLLPVALYGMAQLGVRSLLWLGRTVFDHFGRIGDIFSLDRERLVVTDREILVETAGGAEASWSTKWTVGVTGNIVSLERWGSERDVDDADGTTEDDVDVTPSPVLMPAIACRYGDNLGVYETVGARARFAIGPLVGLTWELETGASCPHRDEVWRDELDWLCAEVQGWIDRKRIDREPLEADRKKAIERLEET